MLSEAPGSLDKKGLGLHANAAVAVAALQLVGLI